ncbi:MAG TPA: diguanylate cyclase [Chitinispirillaceae bacterium]|nr:diguanylate cyclase [Chitinispirillaceae bacterium]
MKSQSKSKIQHYLCAVNGSRDGIWDWDLKNDSIFLCESWKKMLGYSQQQIGTSPEDWFSRIYHKDKQRFKSKLQKCISGKSELFELEYRMVHKDGNLRWMHVRGSTKCDKFGDTTRISGLQTDITVRKTDELQQKKLLDEYRFALASEKVLMEELDRKNRELTELSITDGLTGLFNHRFLQDRFDFELKRVHRYGGNLSCLLIDIDHFKLINDTCGHQFGDSVLRQIANIMKTRSREIDICGRYGGEEFMIITNLRADDALRYATKLHTAIESHPFKNGHRAIKVTVSIGIAEYRSDIKFKQQLIERADNALYQAKKDGRNLIRIWKELESQSDKALDRSGVEDLKLKFEQMSRQMRNTYIESTNVLIKAIDAKDPMAKEHSHNVSIYATEIAKVLNLSESDIEIICNAALLHDVGKISIRDEILSKKSKLTFIELQTLKRHPEIGVGILRELKFLEKELPIILHHHERYDGGGYPHGLKGREIPLGARIIAVADSFDAMISGRSYKKRMSWEAALDELKKGCNTQFAPEIVEAFLKVLRSKKNCSDKGRWLL